MSSGQYDPNAVEGDSGGRSQYLSKKDIKVLLIAIPLLLLILAPVYMVGVENSEKARCTGNVGLIYEAIGLYSTEHDDRLPPVYRTGNDGVEPGLGANGLPWTYASDVIRYMSSRGSFACPSAEPEETVATEHPESSDLQIVSSYGMYLPYGGFLRAVIPDPNNTIILAETSNNGALGSFDPVPYPADGFMIGWSNSNTMPDRSTTAVTRLAFRDVAKGDFATEGRGRHDSGIRAVTANGQLMPLKPPAAQINIQPGTGLPGGLWAFPP